MSWLLPLDIGTVMGLILAWPVVAFAAAFRFLNFPDLTLEGSLPTGAAVYAVAILAGHSVLFAMSAAAAAGALLGALTATIHVWLGINKFLAGIIVVAISYTIDLRLMDASNIGLLRRTSLFDLVSPINNLSGMFQTGTALLLALMLAIGLAVIIVCINSKSGLRLRVAGSNPEYARALGVNVPINLVIGLAICNALVAGSGALLAMYQGFADIGMGQGILILALASMTIGERVIPERRMSIAAYVLISAIVGTLLYEMITAYAIRLGLAATDLKLVTALFVLAIIALRVKNRDDGFLEMTR